MKNIKQIFMVLKLITLMIFYKIYIIIIKIKDTEILLQKM